MSPWEQRCVSADLSDSVVFVDATGVSEQESSGGSGLSNAGESRIIQRIVQLLTNKGVAASSISAITPFKRQVHVIYKGRSFNNLLYLESRLLPKTLVIYV